MVFKISKKRFLKLNKGLSLLEVTLAVLLITIAMGGLFAAFAYGQAQLREEGYRRVALIAALSELEVWRAQSKGRYNSNFDRTCSFDDDSDIQTNVYLSAGDNEAVSAIIERDCSGPHQRKAENAVDWTLYYDVSVTVLVNDRNASISQNEAAKVTLYGQFVDY